MFEIVEKQVFSLVVKADCSPEDLQKKLRERGFRSVTTRSVPGAENHVRVCCGEYQKEQIIQYLEEEEQKAKRQAEIFARIGSA